MNFFGKKRTSAPAPSRNGAALGDPTSTIVTLRESLKTLDKREDHIQKKADSLLEEAKAHLKAKDKKKVRRERLRYRVA